MEKFPTQNLLKICLLLSLIALGAAYLFEYVFGLKPCTLCVYQRYAYMGMIVLSAPVYALRKENHTKLLKGTIGLTLLNGCIAAYQVMVEQGIVETAAFCPSNKLSNSSLEALKESLKAHTIIPCNEVTFSLFDISMAGYNALFCLSLSIFLICSSLKNMKKDRHMLKVLF